MPDLSVIVRLKPGREKVIAQGHPWVFSGALAEIQGSEQPGAVTEVLAHDGTWLGRGLMHPGAELRIRLYTWKKEEAIDDSLFVRRIEEACRLREEIFSHQSDKTDAYRLIYSEADGISGLIVDRYARALVIQIGAQVLERYLDGILQHLARRTGLRDIVVKCDEDAVTREGVNAEVLHAKSTGSVQRIEIRQHGLKFEVDLEEGQKTGFYLDQRVNRQRVAQYAQGRRVLSAYCYTGAFEVYAAQAGAGSITGVDSSQSALNQAVRHHQINELTVPVDYRKADVPQALRKFRDEGRDFDEVILDPPRFIANRAQKEKGIRAYKDINLLGMKLLSNPGIMATFSCSGLLSQEEFVTMVKWAAADAGRNIRIVELLSQPPDHPVLPAFQESQYLKGLICWVT